ncbi:MAG TPA: hypothetical protein VKB79_08385 [Bryobacteraceae bacterium]|nr:hypothetical protein [Bryobacteraceae bacterium]
MKLTFKRNLAIPVIGAAITPVLTTEQVKGLNSKLQVFVDQLTEGERLAFEAVMEQAMAGSRPQEQPRQKRRKTARGERRS